MSAEHCPYCDCLLSDLRPHIDECEKNPTVTELMTLRVVVNAAISVLWSALGQPAGPMSLTQLATDAADRIEELKVRKSADGDE